MEQLQYMHFTKLGSKPIFWSDSLVPRLSRNQLLTKNWWFLLAYYHYLCLKPQINIHYNLQINKPTCVGTHTSASHDLMSHMKWEPFIKLGKIAFFSTWGCEILPTVQAISGKASPCQFNNLLTSDWNFQVRYIMLKLDQLRLNKNPVNLPRIIPQCDLNSHFEWKLHQLHITITTVHRCLPLIHCQVIELNKASDMIHNTELICLE